MWTGFKDRRMIVNMYECSYCEKSFTDKSNRNRHVKGSVKCIRGRTPLEKLVVIQSDLMCLCGYSTSRADALSRHQGSCSMFQLEKYKNRFYEQEKTHESLVNRYEETITDLVKTHEERITNLVIAHEKTVVKLEEQVKLLMTRPININTHNHHNTTNNNNNSGHTYNMSYYKQHIQDNFESITQPLLQGVMNQITLEDISYGGSGIAKFVKKHLDHQHLLMLDQARRKGAYKDAKGQVVVDSKLRTLLQMIGEAAYPPAKKIFIDWNTANPDGFLNSSKCKILSSLLGATGWLNRVGEGKTHQDDSEILSSFVDELASGYTKEALHNHLDQHSWPPDADEEPEVENPSGDESDVSSDWPGVEEEPDSDEYGIGEDYETDIETASITSSQFEVVIGRKNYEACRDRGTRDEDNLYQNFKTQSIEHFII
jgi:hypothetical protein